MSAKKYGVYSRTLNNANKNGVMEFNHLEGRHCNEQCVPSTAYYLTARILYVYG